MPPKKQNGLERAEESLLFQWVWMDMDQPGALSPGQLAKDERNGIQ